jgi:hypothetical protein
MARRRFRRFTIHPPYLVDRIPPGLLKKDPEEATKVMVRTFDQAMQELHRFLRYLMNTQDDGLPAGAYDEIPEPAEAGSFGAVGEIEFGWAPGQHEHPVPVGVPEPTGLANAEGSSTEFVRRDHVHLANSIVEGNLVTNILFVDTGTVTWTFTIVGDDIEIRAEIAPGQVIAAPAQPTAHTHNEEDVRQRFERAPIHHDHQHVHRYDELVGDPASLPPDQHARFWRQPHTHRYEDVRANGTETVLANQIFGG